MIVRLIVALMSVAFTSNALAKPPAKQVLTPQSETALIVIKAPWWQPAPSMLSAYKIGLSAYDAPQAKIAGGPFSGFKLIEARRKNFADGYLIEEIKPGRWIYQSYSQQDKWALCFNAATLQFEVKPGEVLYLGELDAESHRQELTDHAMMSGKVSISGYGFADFFDLPAGPRLAPIDEAQLAAVRTMLVGHAPQVTAPVRAAEYSPAKFGTGSTLFAERKCGGYFAESAIKAKRSKSE